MNGDIDVGDLIAEVVSQHNGNQIEFYMVVQVIDGLFFRGNLRDTVYGAKENTTEPTLYYAAIRRDRAFIVEKFRPAAPAATSGRCSCPWSMLVKGCACGAIQPYKMEIGR